MLGRSSKIANWIGEKTPFLLYVHSYIPPTKKEDVVVLLQLCSIVL